MKLNRVTQQVDYTTKATYITSSGFADVLKDVIRLKDAIQEEKQSRRTIERKDESSQMDFKT